MLAGKFTDIMWPTQKVVISIHLLLWLQAISSALFMVLIFKYSDDDIETGAQTFLGFVYTPLKDQLIMSLIILLFFKMLFQMKRVQIQMNEKNTTVRQTLRALKRFFCIEKTILTFYIIEFLWLIFILAYLTNRIFDNEAIVDKVIDRSL